MERLLAVYESGAYDLIVLDTPPTRNALDFLDAPGRMLQMLQAGVLKWLTPGTGGFSSKRAAAVLFGRGQKALFSVFERFVGAEVFSGMSEFVDAMSDLLDGMARRADRVATLLEGSRVAFVLVAAPNRIALTEALFFHQRLVEGGIHLAGLVLNRVQTEPPAECIETFKGPLAAELADRSEDPGWEQAAEELWAAGLAGVERFRQEQEQCLRLRRALGDALPLAQIPELDGPAHDLSGLSAILPYL